MAQASSRWKGFAAARRRTCEGGGNEPRRSLRTLSGSNVAVLLQRTETSAAGALARQRGPAIRDGVGKGALGGRPALPVPLQPLERAVGAGAEAFAQARAELVDPGLDDVRRRLEVALEGVGGAADAEGLVDAGLAGHQGHAGGRDIERVLMALHDPLRIGQAVQQRILAAGR